MHHRRLLLACATVLATTGAAASAQSTFIGANNGTWGTAGNWSPAGVPSSTTDARINDNASNVNVVVSVASNVRQLTIDAGDSVGINNGQRLGLFGDLLNNGLLKVNSSGSNSYLMPSGTITLNGSGVVELADPTSSLEVWFYDVNNTNLADDHIINSATHTIRGEGVIGFAATTQITNHGIIEATGIARSLTLSPNSAGLLNTGTLRATGTGVLVLNGANLGTTFTNTGATIEAQAGATVLLDNVPRIVGGTVTGAGAVAVPASDRAIYENLTHGATTTVNNGGRLDLVGTIVNNGVIKIDSSSANTYVQPSGTVTLTGSGSIEIVDVSASEAWLYDNTNANGASDHLINSAGHTIRGAGNVGFGTTTQITNHGVIEATTPAPGLPLRVAPNAAGLLNTGTMRATGTATLVLDGGNLANTFTNTGATIEAQGGAVVALDNIPRIVGGTVTGAGMVSVVASDRAIYEGLTHSTTTTVNNGGRLDLVGTIVNNGLIIVSSPSGNTYLQPSGTVTLSGTGAVELADPGATNESWIYDATNANAAADHLINGPGHTIRGNGNIGFAGNLQITNNGTFDATSTALPMNVLPNAAGGFVNNGTLRASGGGTLNLSRGEVGATYSGSGPLVAQVGSVIQTSNGATGSLGAVSGAGTLRATGAGTNLGFQSFDVGTVSATSSGVVRITTGGGNLGTSRAGTISLTTSGRLDIADHGLIVTGMTYANVRLLLVAGRNAGQWNGVNGIGSSIANNNGRAVAAALASELFAAPGTFLGQPFVLTDVLLRVTVAGDSTFDGTVNFDDLLKLAANYNVAGTGTWAKGDYNYDTNVNFDDLLILAANYNTSMPPASLEGGWALATAGAVPEPASVATTLVTAGTMLRRRRRA